MNLSRLIYLCIKNVNYFDNSFNIYDLFNGAYNLSTDYTIAIENIDTPLNEAIQRLSDMEKIPYKVKELNVANNIIEYSNTDKIKEIVNVAIDNIRVPFAPYGLNKIRILKNVPNGTALVEYKEEIPEFISNTLGTINNSFDDDDNDGVFDDGLEALTIHNDVDLTTYGINNAMCQYIIEYCQGKLEEQVDPSLANMHLIRAEQYFANLKTQRSAFVQERVFKKYNIG